VIAGKCQPLRVEFLHEGGLLKTPIGWSDPINFAAIGTLLSFHLFAVLINIVSIEEEFDPPTPDVPLHAVTSTGTKNLVLALLDPQHVLHTFSLRLTVSMAVSRFEAFIPVSRMRIKMGPPL
jgi:hypothetical protein